MSYTWVEKPLNARWREIATSSDGTKLAAIASNGRIYTSTDSGLSWTARAFNNRWWSLASSSDGTKLVAVVNGGNSGYIWHSSNSGISWTLNDLNMNGINTISRNWADVTSSSDGVKLAAVAMNGNIFISNNEGSSWSAATIDGQGARGRRWWGITSSSDGTKLAAVVRGGYIYTSTDSGASWQSRKSAGHRSWISITSSSDGTKLAATTYLGQIYTSIDSGLSWTATAPLSRWWNISSSSDGNILFATTYFPSLGRIYIGNNILSSTTTTTSTTSTTTTLPPSCVLCGELYFKEVENLKYNSNSQSYTFNANMPLDDTELGNLYIADNLIDGIADSGIVISKLWGNNDTGYRIDSNLIAAIRHANILNPGEVGTIEVENLGLQKKFIGTKNNFIISDSFNIDNDQNVQSYTSIKLSRYYGNL